jgi:hypothetical protein
VLIIFPDFSEKERYHINLSSLQHTRKISLPRRKSVEKKAKKSEMYVVLLADKWKHIRREEKLHKMCAIARAAMARFLV